MRTPPTSAIINAPVMAASRKPIPAGNWKVHAKRLSSTVVWFCMMKTKSTINRIAPTMSATHVPPAKVLLGATLVWFSLVLVSE